MNPALIPCQLEISNHAQEKTLEMRNNFNEL